tara:strand:+ start:2490 stop:2705 length:216 start_codon:yes stop_codon:yes gene_type:complete
MRQFNPVRNVYINMDIENLKDDTLPDTNKKGLLAPVKNMMQKQKDKPNSPAINVARHMKVIRQKRENLNGT